MRLLEKGENDSVILFVVFGGTTKLLQVAIKNVKSITLFLAIIMYVVLFVTIACSGILDK